MSDGGKRHTRKTRHREKAKRKFGPAAVRSHRKKGGRTGSVWAKKVKP